MVKVYIFVEDQVLGNKKCPLI